MIFNLILILFHAQHAKSWECGGDRSELNQFDLDNLKRDLQYSEYDREATFNPQL